MRRDYEDRPTVAETALIAYFVAKTLDKSAQNNAPYPPGFVGASHFTRKEAIPSAETTDHDTNVDKL